MLHPRASLPRSHLAPLLEFRYLQSVGVLCQQPQRNPGHQGQLPDVPPSLCTRQLEPGIHAAAPKGCAYPPLSWHRLGIRIPHHLRAACMYASEHWGA